MSPKYVGYSNETLEAQLEVKAGDKIMCDLCQEQHELTAASDLENGEPVAGLLFYKCGESVFLGAVSGKLVIHTKPDASGDTPLGGEDKP